MKWLIIQSAGKHTGSDGWTANDHLRECHSVRFALESLGQKADIWGARHPNFACQPDFSRYDAILVLENYEMEWLPDLSKIAALKIAWLIDEHWQDSSVYESLQENCDYILHSTLRYVRLGALRHPRAKHVWFPNAIDERYFLLDNYKSLNFQRTENIIFIGGKPLPRIAAVEAMEARAGLKYAYGVTGIDYIHALLKAKMQFNQSINLDINYRTFETIGMGCCLLTNFQPELAALGFQSGVNCLMYHETEGAILLAKEYLKHGWKLIADAGPELAKRHTYTIRMAELLRLIWIN
jgi:hypothetical protein